MGSRAVKVAFTRNKVQGVKFYFNEGSKRFGCIFPSARRAWISLGASSLMYICLGALAKILGLWKHFLYLIPFSFRSVPSELSLNPGEAFQISDWVIQRLNILSCQHYYCCDGFSVQQYWINISWWKYSCETISLVGGSASSSLPPSGLGTTSCPPVICSTLSLGHTF